MSKTVRYHFAITRNAYSHDCILWMWHQRWHGTHPSHLKCLRCSKIPSVLFLGIILQIACNNSKMQHSIFLTLLELTLSIIDSFIGWVSSLPEMNAWKYNYKTQWTYYPIHLYMAWTPTLLFFYPLSDLQLQWSKLAFARSPNRPKFLLGKCKILTCPIDKFTIHPFHFGCVASRIHVRQVHLTDCSTHWRVNFSQVLKTEVGWVPYQDWIKWKLTSSF